MQVAIPTGILKELPSTSLTKFRPEKLKIKKRILISFGISPELSGRHFSRVPIRIFLWLITLRSDDFFFLTVER